MSAEGELNAFYAAWRGNFERTLAQAKGHPALADALAAQACEAYERNAEILSDGLPESACHRGCDFCCCLQVAASAPEIFHAAHFIRLTAEAFARNGVDLARRLHEVQQDIAGKSQKQRFLSRVACPLVIGAACAIYSARPLACRGHIAFDAEACRRAAQGEEVEAMISSVHRDVRAIVQTALLAALADAALPSDVYEFLGALDMALRFPDAEARWRQGEDVFGAFRLD